MTPEILSQKLGHVLVEIGPGHNPIDYWSESIIGEDDLHICLERSPFVLKSPQLKGDMGYIPLRDSIADEIWAMNVFGEHHAEHPAVYDPFYLESQDRLVLPRSTEVFFEEMARVLKPHGRIIIGEFLTPPPLLPEIDFSVYDLRKEILRDELYYQFIGEYRLKRIYIAKIDGGNSVRPYFLILTKD